MIGFYNYTVLLTYLGLVSSVAGMMFAVNGWFRAAILCLAISGLCDTLDGKVARMKKDRTEEEKCFGIQIDSLCDIVCFGMFPVILSYCLGMRGPAGIMILVLYAVAGVIRLGYFNVMEMKRQQETEETRKYYSGLPITSIAIVLPIVFLVRTVVSRYFLMLLHLSMLVVGTLFVVDFPVKKPKNSTIAAFVVLVASVLVWIGLHR